MKAASPFQPAVRQSIQSIWKRPARTRAILIAAAFVGAIATGSDSLGQTSNWANPAGGLYSEPTNWSAGVPPQGGNAFFLLGGTYPVEVDIEAINLNTIFAATNSTINLDISANSFTTFLMKVGTGAGTNNQVTLSGAGLLDAGTIEIAPSLGQGSLTVNSRIQSNYIVVGGQASFPGFFAMTPGGQGTLTINDGADVAVKGLLADNAGAGSKIVHNGGVLSIRGVGRFNTQTSPQSFTRIGDGVHSAVLNLQNDILPNGTEVLGQYDFGNETVSIADGSTIHFDSRGGSLTIGNIVRESPTQGSSGAFNWIAGRINLTSSELRVGNTGQFGSSLDLAVDKFMSASLGTQIEAGSTMTLSGGSLETSSISSAGSFIFERGLLSVTEGDLKIGSGGITNSGGVIIDSSGSIAIGGLLTVEADRAVNLTGGSLTVNHLKTNGSVTIESGYLSSNRIFHNGSGSAAQFSVLYNSGDGGAGSTLVSQGMERNNLIVNGGTVQISSDDQTFDPMIDGALVGGYTGDSSMLLVDGFVAAPTMRIGVTEGFVDTVTINGGSLITENLISNGGARSVLNFNGGTISTGHSEIDGPSTFTVGNGTTEALLILTGTGTHTFADGIELSASGRISGEGTIIGDIVNAGRISPGNSPGVFSIEGDLLNQGLIEFEIESQTAFDSIIASGTFDAGGVISVSLLGYEPSATETFDLLDYGSFFDSGYVFDFSNAALNPGLTWDTTMFEIDGSISVTAVPEPSAMMHALCGIAFIFLRRRVRTASPSQRDRALE